MIYKYTLLLIFIIFSSNLVFAQNKNIDKLFSKYSNTNGFSSVQLKDPGKTLPNMTKRNQKEIKELLDGVEHIKVLSMEDDKVQKPTSEQFREEVMNLQPGEGFKEIFSVKDGGNALKMHIKDNNGSVSDLLMLVSEEKKVTLIWFNGKLDLEKLTKSASMLPNILK